MKKIALAAVLPTLLVVLIQCGSGDPSENASSSDVPTAQITVHKEGPLPVDIYAEEKNITGIRITVDDDLRRPYWIEQGNSKRFFIKERIVIESGGTYTDPTTGAEHTTVPRFGLSINEQRWPDSTYQGYPRVEIIRLDPRE